MKNTYIKMAAAFMMLATVSCKKNDLPVIATPVTGTEAQIKFFNFGVNSPGVYFYNNDSKISAVLSATGVESSAGIAYGSVFPATNYSIVAAGQSKLTAVIPSTATANAGVTVATINSNLEAGKFYSMYTCGIYDATNKASDAFVINDVLPPVDQSGYVRFVNTVINGTAGFNLYAKNTLTGVETLVGGNIAYKSGSSFVALDPGIYEFYARYPSAPTVNVISRNGTSVVTVIGMKAYTVTARGDASITATVKPFLDQTPNR